MGSQSSEKDPFFCLPGNRLTTVGCFNFLVMPHLRIFHGQPDEKPIVHSSTFLALHHSGPIPQTPFAKPSESQAVRKPSHLRLFWHGIIDGTASQVTLIKDQGSNEVRPLLSANCWVVAPKGPEQISHGTWADCYSSLPSSIGGDTPKRDSTDQNSSSEPLRSAAGPCWIVASMKWFALPQWIP